MKTKIIVTFKNSEEVQNYIFHDQETLDNFLAMIVANKTFGEPEDYTLTPEDCTAELDQQKINMEALQYLAETDFLIIKEFDTGIACPLEIKLARAQARSKIIR